MRKRFIAGILCTVVCGMMLAACGNDTSGTAIEETESIDIESESAQTQLESGKVSLTVWGAEEDQELLQEVAEGFKQQYAGYADFEITVAVESESTCKDTLLADLENGADVFTFVDDQLMSLVAAGALEKVPDADAIKAANVEESSAAASVHDTLYAYPMTADNGYFMYYNKEYFFDTDVQTLDSMLAVAAANGKKVAMDWSSGWYLYSFFGNTGLTLGLNEDGISNYCTWNATDGAIKGTDVAEAMLAIAANPGFANMVDSDFLVGVKDGSVIAGISGVWDSVALEEAWGSNYGAVKLPTYTCAGQQVQMASFAGYKMVGANAYSSHAQWAIKFAEYMTNEENQNLRFAKRGQGPSNINAANSQAVSDSPAIQAILQQAEFSSLQRIGGKYWDPVTEFGTTMANLNPSGKPLQDILDLAVEGITEK